MRIGVLGATGYAGSELLRLAASHPELKVLIASGSSSAGRRLADHVPSLAGAYPDLMVSDAAAVLDADLDVVFLALPHGESQGFVPELHRRDIQVVDLGADYRLKNPSDYATWYGRDHSSSELLNHSVYGLVERHRAVLAGARLTSVPGF